MAKPPLLFFSMSIDKQSTGVTVDRGARRKEECGALIREECIKDVLLSYGAETSPCCNLELH